MPLPRLQGHGVAQAVHRGRQACEVVVPRSGVGESGDHVDGRHVEVANEHRVLVWTIQMNALALARAVHVKIVGPKHGLVRFQIVQSGNGLGQSKSVFVGQIVPRRGLLIELAILCEGAVEAVKDADLIAQLAPLPHHFGPWNGQEESMCHGQAIHRSGLFFGVIAVERVAIGAQLVRHALFVVALRVGQQVGPLVASVLPRAVVDVAVVAHHRLGVFRGHFAPNHEPAVGQRRLFVVVAKVFQNQIRPRMVAPDVVRVVEQDVHAALVVLVPCADV